MTLTIRGKIVIISVVIIILALGATILVNSIVFTREYSNALQLKTFVIAQTLKSQLDRLLKLKIPLADLVGFEEQCQEVLANYEEISYAMVVDLDGTILFHHDPSQHDQVMVDPSVLEDIRNPKGASRVYSSDGERFYNVSVPVFGTNGGHIAAVVLGFPTEHIAQKTRKMIVYSLEVALSFIVLAIILLIIFLNVWVSRPLRKLMTVIYDIRQKGTDSTKLVEVYSGDEIGLLSSAFNQMMIELRDSHEKIKNYAQELEEKVRERTAELKAANEQLEKDVSERKRAQNELNRAYQKLKSTQAQLIQSAKLASIGELASGVAHELNQPLMVIRAMAQLLQRNLQKGNPEAEQLKKHLEPVERNTKRMMNIINHLRTFSREAQMKFYSLNVNKIIEDSFLMVGEQLRLHNIEVKKNLAPNLPKVRGDANQLEQVVLNLLTNARDAIEAKGKKEGRTIEIVTCISGENNKFVEILLSDSGTGIAPKHLEKIFDPFFTSKVVGKGTGLGLSISYGIIQDHSGFIEVAETGPEGTTFRIRLPVSIED